MGLCSFECYDGKRNRVSFGKNATMLNHHLIFAPPNVKHPVLMVYNFPVQVCFLPGTLALGATKGITKEKALKDNSLTFEDLENLKLAEDLAKTCFEMYSVTATGLAPEIAYFHTEVGWTYITSFFKLPMHIYIQ